MPWRKVNNTIRFPIPSAEIMDEDQLIAKVMVRTIAIVDQQRFLSPDERVKAMMEAPLRHWTTLQDGYRTGLNGMLLAICNIAKQYYPSGKYWRGN